MQAGRLVRLSALELKDPEAASCWLVHPPELMDWPPLVALRNWLSVEVVRSNLKA